MLCLIPLGYKFPVLYHQWCEELTHLKRPWCWERLKAGEGDDRGWDGWMASLTQWTWVWVNSENQWWTGRPGVLRSMGSQRVRDDWATELNWTEPSVEKWEKQGSGLPCREPLLCYNRITCYHLHGWRSDPSSQDCSELLTRWQGWILSTF